MWLFTTANMQLNNNLFHAALSWYSKTIFLQALGCQVAKRYFFLQDSTFDLLKY